MVVRVDGFQWGHVSTGFSTEVIYTFPVHLVAIGNIRICKSCFFQMIPLVERANTLHIHPIVSKIVGDMFVDVNGK